MVHVRHVPAQPAGRGKKQKGNRGDWQPWVHRGMGVLRRRQLVGGGVAFVRVVRG